jgi:hypothetical protein
MVEYLMFLANVTIIKMNLPKKIMEEKVCCHWSIQIHLKALFGSGKIEYLSKYKQVQRICPHDTVGTLKYPY